MVWTLSLCVKGASVRDCYFDVKDMKLVKFSRSVGICCLFDVLVVDIQSLSR